MDDSCLFRAFSILVNGDESKHLELRIRCIIELVNNQDIYLGDEDLAERIRAQERILGVNVAVHRIPYTNALPLNG